MDAQTRIRNTIAFTLPISCQICLGKVKQPVVCPNQHVFCAQCMQVWMERNTVCPTCRVPIVGSAKPVLGGMNPDVEKPENFSDRELRRARMELIYKEYEGEIDRLEAELAACQEENKHLRGRVGKCSPEAKSPSSPQDKNTITLLNNKLKDATALYKNVRADMDKMRQENASLRNIVEDMNREKQSLKLELGSRSPRKFGRYTVATLETKLEASEKQVKQLERALEKSDSYIEDIEADLEHHRKVMCAQCKRKMSSRPTAKASKGKAEKDSLDFESSTLDINDSKTDGELPSKISLLSDDDDTDYRFSDTERTKRLHLSESFDLEGPKSDKSSFMLEMPSPMGKGVVIASDADTTEGSFLAQKGKVKTAEATLDSTKKRLRFMVSDDEKDFNKGGILRNGAMASQGFSLHGLTSMPKSITSSAIISSTVTKPDSNKLLDVSMTPEMEDCFKLIDNAERKLGAQDTLPGSSASSTMTSLFSTSAQTTNPPASSFSVSSGAIGSNPAASHSLFSSSVSTSANLPVSFTSSKTPAVVTTASVFTSSLPVGHPLATSVFPSHNVPLSHAPSGSMPDLPASFMDGRARYSLSTQ